MTHERHINSEFLKQFLSSNKIPFQSTQQRLCIPIIQRIYLKMINNIKFEEIKIFEDLIIDGHHRYLSSLIANKTLGNVPTQKTSATKKFNWNEIEFVETDWDTKEKIIELNRRDAEYNNISIEVINQIVFDE